MSPLFRMGAPVQVIYEAGHRTVGTHRRLPAAHRHSGELLPAHRLAAAHKYVRGGEHG